MVSTLQLALKVFFYSTLPGNQFILSTSNKQTDNRQLNKHIRFNRTWYQSTSLSTYYLYIQKWKYLYVNYFLSQRPLAFHQELLSIQFLTIKVGGAFASNWLVRLIVCRVGWTVGIFIILVAASSLWFKEKTCFFFLINTIVDLQDITLKENKELHQLLFAHCEQSIRQDHSQHYLLLFSPGA